MNNLNELEKITIEFPVTITEGEIEEKFFSHLRDKVPCDITYGRDPRKNKDISFGGNFIRYFGPHIVTNLRFEIGGGLIRFELSEYACSRNEQLFIDEVRQKAQDYFSQRPK